MENEAKAQELFEKGSEAYHNKNYKDVYLFYHKNRL
jgi:hypothetical protein